MGKILKNIFLLIIFTVSSSAYGENLAVKPSLVYLTSDLSASISQNEFNCDEKIFVVAYFKQGLQIADYNIKAIWTAPNGEVFHKTSKDVSTSKNQNAYWLWLQIEQSLIESSFGSPGFSGTTALIGKWTVEFYINDTFVSKNAFFMSC